MLVRLLTSTHIITMHRTKEVKPVIVLSLVSNCNLLQIFVASLLSVVIQCYVPALLAKDVKC